MLNISSIKENCHFPLHKALISISKSALSLLDLWQTNFASSTQPIPVQHWNNTTPRVWESPRHYEYWECFKCNFLLIKNVTVCSKCWSNMWRLQACSFNPEQLVSIKLHSHSAEVLKMGWWGVFEEILASLIGMKTAMRLPWVCNRL